LRFGRAQLRSVAGRRKEEEGEGGKELWYNPETLTWQVGAKTLLLANFS